jgi:hypothetical protein
MSTDNTSRHPLPILGWSSAKWDLLRRKPDTFSDTHRFRTISHEEFRVLSRYLDVYRNLGKIIVDDPLSAVILHRLTGFAVEQTGWRYPGKYSYDRIPNPLGEHDHVLVAYGTASGMYVHISYAQADRAKFRDMVVTGVIEPKTISYPPVSKLIVVAGQVARNVQRIDEARRLLAKTKDAGRKAGLERIISDFTQETESQIAIDRITPRIIDDVIASVEKELEFLAKEHDKSSLLLQIDSALDQNSEYHSTSINEDRQVHQRRTEAIGQNIAQHQAILADLKILGSYILASSSEGNS